MVRLYRICFLMLLFYFILFLWGTTQEQRVRGRRSSRQRLSRTRHPQKATWTRWDVICIWIFGFCANTPCYNTVQAFCAFFCCYLFLEIADIYVPGTVSCTWTEKGTVVGTRFRNGEHALYCRRLWLSRLLVYETCGACGFCPRLDYIWEMLVCWTWDPWAIYLFFSL